MTLKTTMSNTKVHHICITSVTELQISPRFMTYMLVENQKCTKWPQNDLKRFCQNNLYAHQVLTYEAQIVVRFALRAVVSRCQLDCQKLEITKLNSDWPWTRVKSTLYTHYDYSRRPKCWSISLYDQLFSGYKVVENRKNQKCTE